MLISSMADFFMKLLKSGSSEFLPGHASQVEEGV